MSEFCKGRDHVCRAVDVTRVVGMPNEVRSMFFGAQPVRRHVCGRVKQDNETESLRIADEIQRCERAGVRLSFFWYA